MMFQNAIEGMSDLEFYQNELRMAELAEPLNFSSIWCVEHHFDGDYSIAPDNTQILSYLAAKTTNITLAPAAIILPWWEQPLRVAEKVSLLDTLSGGRVELGVGRGLSKTEYQQMGIPMGESRERFGESVKLVLDALETGTIEGSGKHYTVPSAPIRPRPLQGFKDRLFVIAMTEDSVKEAAHLGAAMATFIQFPIEQHAELINLYRQEFTDKHQKAAPAPTLTEFVFCDRDPVKAEEIARRYISSYFVQVMRHYDFAGEHFAKTPGYASYDAVARAIRESGKDAAAEAYFQAQTWGTPEQIIEKIKHQRSVVGDFRLSATFAYAGMPYETAEQSMRLFSEAVLPELENL